MNSFFIGLIVLLLSGFAVKFLDKKFKIIVVSLLNLIASCLCAVPALKVLSKGGVLAQVFNFNNLFGSVCFQIDYLSAFLY